jgi:hypothetical protein
MIDSVNDGALLKKVMKSSNEQEVAVSFACMIDTPHTHLKDIWLSNHLNKKVLDLLDLTELGVYPPNMD